MTTKKTAKKKAAKTVEPSLSLTSIKALTAAQISDARATLFTKQQEAHEVHNKKLRELRVLEDAIAHRLDELPEEEVDAEETKLFEALSKEWAEIKKEFKALAKKEKVTIPVTLTFEFEEYNEDLAESSVENSIGHDVSVTFDPKGLGLDKDTQGQVTEYLKDSVSNACELITCLAPEFTAAVNKLETKRSALIEKARRAGFSLYDLDQ